MEWAVWRIWLSKHATLQELETHWSIYDALDANDALDVLDEMNAQQARRR